MELDQKSFLLSKISTLPPEEQKRLLKLVQQLDEARVREEATDKFLPFVKAMWPAFIEGRHHKIMAEAFERVANGTCKRLIVNMPPRHTKSEFASHLLPAWFMGKFPGKKIIQTAHTAELSVGFGRKVRDLIHSEDYHKVFPNTALKADNKAAGRWNTSAGGEYFAIGVGGRVTGKGADLFIIDDPHSEQEAALAAVNPDVFDKVHEWYTSGPRQRLQPGAAIVMVMTRWSTKDLTGQVLKKSIERNSEEWEVIEFPAILPSGDPLWPEFWSLKELKALEEELPLGKWLAQYQQNPTAEEGAIIKRDWWKEWTRDNPPTCDAILISWDTAFLKTERADYSACTTWGIFSEEDGETGFKRQKAIMLDGFRKRMEFPELKKAVLAHYTDWEPDMLIVEAKASGSSLIQELRAMGIPVTEFTPSRGNDKIVRANSVSDMFASGQVYYPANKRWAEEVIEECAQFPNGDYDDYVDTVTQALIRFRQGGFIKTTLDEEEERDEYWKWRRKQRAYY
jgi:predicted phage terminase large subunit-like protein